VCDSTLLDTRLTNHRSKGWFWTPSQRNWKQVWEKDASLERWAWLKEENWNSWNRSK